MNKVLVGIVAVAALVSGSWGAEPAPTIYNQNFAVVRETVSLQLKKGVSPISFSEITAHVEPDSLLLKDIAGKQQIRILEQNYRADPVSKGLLLSLYEGETLQFRKTSRSGEEPQIVSGKVIRSGYDPHSEDHRRYGITDKSAIIEVDGHLEFGLPGEPLFPALKDDTVLKPTLTWLLESPKEGKVEAELSYITGGMSWKSSYNVVGDEKGDEVDIIGWVTMDNQSGRTFTDAKIKLMAGDVSKVAKADSEFKYKESLSLSAREAAPKPEVKQQDFDDYHLYTIERKTTLRDRETKQVEFLRAVGVKSKKVYVYRGLGVGLSDYLRSRYGWNDQRPYTDEGQMVAPNKKIWIMREFKNSEDNRLGMPLPKGLVRFYQRGSDKQMEFLGENSIDHTPKDETIRLYTGNAFDLSAERKRVEFASDRSDHWIDEKFEVCLRNHKKETAEIRVIEDLVRWHNWEVQEKSHEFTKTDSQTIEFGVPLAPGEEKVVSYKVHYTW